MLTSCTIIYCFILWFNHVLSWEMNPEFNGRCEEQQVQIRQHVHCSIGLYKYYMNTLYWLKLAKNEIFVPGVATFYGKLKNPQRNMCLEGKGTAQGVKTHPTIAPCTGDLYGDQYWLMTKEGEILRPADDRIFNLNNHRTYRVSNCLDYPGDQKLYEGALIMYECHALHKNQLWQYDKNNGLVKSQDYEMCLEAMESVNSVMMAECKEGGLQEWKFENEVGI